MLLRSAEIKPLFYRFVLLNISPLLRIPEDMQLGELVRLYYYVLLVPEDVHVNGLVSSQLSSVVT